VLLTCFFIFIAKITKNYQKQLNSALLISVTHQKGHAHKNSTIMDHCHPLKTDQKGTNLSQLFYSGTTIAQRTPNSR
jgi:hypothetical protein